MIANIDQLLEGGKGFSGAISLPLLPDLIQVFTLSQTTGALGIHRADSSGTIWFDNGNIVHAICDGRSGEAAVYELLCWQGGEFFLDTKAGPTEKTITVGWQELVLEGCRLLDEAGHDSALAEKAGEVAPPTQIAVPTELVPATVTPSRAQSRRPARQRTTSNPPANKAVMDSRESAIVFRGHWHRRSRPGRGSRHIERTSSGDFANGRIRRRSKRRRARRGAGKVGSLKESLRKIATIDGFLGVSVVDSDSGMMLESEGSSSSINLALAAAGNTELVRAQRKTIASLGLNDEIEDILITLGKQYHLIRRLSCREALFVYLVLDKDRGNLATARLLLSDIEKTIII